MTIPSRGTQREAADITGSFLRRQFFNA